MKIRSFLSWRDTKLSTEKVLLTKSLSHNIFPEQGNKEGSPTNEISAIIRSNMEIGKKMWNQNTYFYSDAKFAWRRYFPGNFPKHVPSVFKIFVRIALTTPEQKPTIRMKRYRSNFNMIGYSDIKYFISNQDHWICSICTRRKNNRSTRKNEEKKHGCMSSKVITKTVSWKIIN